MNAVDLGQYDAFFQLFDTIKMPVYWKDTEGRCVSCNQHFLKLVGVDNQEQIIGKTDDAFWGQPEDIARTVESDLLALRNGQSEIHISKIICGEDRHFSVIKTRLANKDGKVEGVLAAFIDNIAEKSHQMMQIIDLVSASIYWKDKKGRYLGCNKFVLDLAGVKSREQIIGKTDTDLIWKEHAPVLMTVDRQVMEHGGYVGEEVINKADGKVMTALTVKNQLRDSDGNIIGTIGTSLDITAQKEAEELKLENARQQISLRENYAQVARKVAHDINSPVAALKMMLDTCNELPENKRTFLRRAAESVIDIANNLLINDYREEKSASEGIEPREILLVSDVLVHLLSEKKVQHQERSVKFKTAITNDAQFAFIQMQKTEFQRAVSNLINNAVDALDEKANGIVTVKLATDDKFAIVTIKDNGKGMPAAMIKKIIDGQSFTEGKANGHGLGLQQVWDTLIYNDGAIDIQSEPGKGSSIQLTFPRTAASSWVAQNIHLKPDSIVIILDDDESIHTAWSLRFAPLMDTYPALRLLHFTHGQEVLGFLETLSKKQRQQVVLLSDYELLHQDRNGLQIIKASKIKHAVLVTSYYFNSKIREAAIKLRVKILPKQMASVIPIGVN